MADKIFETYYSCPETDLFAKAAGLNAHLKSNPPDYLDGLGMVMLEAVKPVTKVRCPNGEIKDMIMLGANSFLGLNSHPEVIEASRSACDLYGSGAGSPPLYAGQTLLHSELEEYIAAFLGVERALIFPCGYYGNIGVLSALCRSNDVVISDTSNHASLFDGIALSGAQSKCYLHRNMKHLSKVLNSLPESMTGRLIVSDGVFSMEGSLAPVDEICRLARQHDARVMIDDAHGFGVIGSHGKGTASLFKCMDKVDIHYGTFSKAFGTIGGFCGGSADLIEYLKYYARSYFFSSALPAFVAAGVLASFKLLEKEPEIIEKLYENSCFLRNSLEQLGFDTLGSRSAIVPVLVGDDEILGKLQMELFQKGVFTNIGTTPAVNRKQCRLRMNAMASHSREQLTYVVDCLETLGRKYGIIK
jgi:8-amino-7-oxononanoate synthase